MQQRHFDHFLDPLFLTMALLCKVRGEPRPIKCDFLTVRTGIKIRDLLLQYVFDITK